MGSELRDSLKMIVVKIRLKQAAPLSERGHPLKKGRVSSRTRRVLAVARARAKQGERRDDHKGHRADSQGKPKCL